MSLSHSPKVVTDGLVFYYDMANTQKSWRGAPTTNMYADGDFSSLALHPVRSGTWAIVDDPRNSLKKVLKATPSGSNQFHGRDITAVVSTLYSLQMEIYVSADFNGTNVQMYPEQGGSGAAVAYNLANKGTWQALKFHGKSASTTNIRLLAYILSSFTVGYVLISNVQAEQSSVATPFVNGTRSNTEAIVDLTNKNTVTSTSLTYASDGSFSFDGITNYATFGNNSAISSIGGTSNITVEAWVKYDTYLGNNGAQSYSVVTHKGTPWTWLMENPSNTGRIRFTIGGVDVNCSDTSTHPLNTWMQWVGTYDGSNMKFYRNGVLKNTVAATGTLGSNAIAATIGEYSGSYRMNGQIPIVKVYTRALPAAEVQQNFSALRGRYGI